MSFLAFFDSFLDTPSYALWVTPLFFSKWKVSWRYVSMVSFISIAFVVAKLWMFKCFPSSKKCHFWVLLGGFLAITPPQCSQILFKFGTVIQINILHHIYYDFWDSAENLKKLPQKPHFVVGFQRFLNHALFRRVGDAPIFGQMKGLMEIHNPGKFHWYSICGCQVIYFQSLSYQQKVGFLAAFWVGFGRLEAQIKSNLYKTFTSDEVQGKVSHVLWALIYYWKFQEMDPKNPIFWAFFRDFLTTPSHSLWVTPKSFIK